MSLHYFISPDFCLEVQAGFLTFSCETQDILILDCREVSDFVAKLYACELAPGFSVSISNKAVLSQDKLAVGTSGEKTLSKSEFDRFFWGLIACIPFMLVREPENQVYVAAAQKLVLFLAGKTSAEEGKLFWKDISAGIHQETLKNFCESLNCDKTKFLNFLFFHFKLLRSIWQLRTLLQKK